MIYKNKTVLITGGGSGIGRAVALHLAQLGSTVIICGRNGASLENTSKACGGVIKMVPADIATETGRATLTEAIASLDKPLDILVNNAGMQNEIQWLENPLEQNLHYNIEAEISINLSAQLLLTTALLKHITRPGGIIINITSLLAIHPKACAPVYSATKAGLRSFTLTLRHQLKPAGIKVVEVLPPLVDTAMTSGRGNGKISPQHTAREIIDGLAKGQTEIRVGLAKGFFLINRFVPKLLAKKMMTA